TRAVVTGSRGACRTTTAATLIIIGCVGTTPAGIHHLAKRRRRTHGATVAAGGIVLADTAAAGSADQIGAIFAQPGTAATGGTVAAGPHLPSVALARHHIDHAAGIGTTAATAA